MSTPLGPIFLLHVCLFRWSQRELRCHNFSLGLTTKVRACKVVAQEGSLGITLHAPGSVGKCEGMNLHTFKGISTLEVGVSVDFRIFRE